MVFRQPPRLPMSWPHGPPRRWSRRNSRRLWTFSSWRSGNSRDPNGRSRLLTPIVAVPGSWPPSPLSLSRLNHLLPRGQANPKVVQCTADFHHPIANALLPQPKPVFDNATALDTAIDMLNPKPALGQ